MASDMMRSRWGVVNGKTCYHLYKTMVVVVWLEPGAGAGSRLVLVCNKDATIKCMRIQSLSYPEYTLMTRSPHRPHIIISTPPPRPPPPSPPPPSLLHHLPP